MKPYNLKNLIDLCKTAKNEKLLEKKIDLIRMAISTLNDLALEHSDGVAQSELKELSDIVESLAAVIKNNQPDAQDIVSKFMTQFLSAMNKR